MLRDLYNWTLKKAESPQAEKWLAGIAFAESSVFPIPPDVMLLPMSLARQDRAIRYAIVCSIASVLGGLAGYAIGYFLWEAAGQPIFEFYGYFEEFERFKAGFNQWGGWLVFIFGLTFFPFKVITIASGVTGLDPFIFTVASLLSRAPRFLIEGILLWKFGAPIQAFIERRLSILTTLFVLLLVGGFVLLNLI